MPALATPPRPILRHRDQEEEDEFGSLGLKKVWFDTVEIKYHKVILGDNPSVSDGAPITIHWKYHTREVLDISNFESKDPTSCRIRRKDGFLAVPTNKAKSSSSSNNSGSGRKSSKELRIDVQDRAALLLKNGYSLTDIGRKVQEVQEIQKERERSAANAKWDGFNAALETSGKVFKR